MDSKTIRRGAEMAICLVAVAATVVLTRILPVPESVAHAALAVALSIAVLTIADGEASPLLYGVPAVMAACLVLPDDRSRLFSFGLILASSLALAATRWFREGTTSMWRAALLLGAALGPARLLPWETGGLPGTIAACLGSLAIVPVCASENRVGLNAILMAFAAVSVTPIVPFRASLFPFVLAAVVFLLRAPNRTSIGVFLLATVAGGKWYWPVGLAVAAGYALSAFRGVRRSGTDSRAAVTIPFVSGNPVASVATFAFAPDAVRRLSDVSAPTALAAALLAGGSLFLQPSVATMYALVALACLLVVDTERALKSSPAAIMFVIAMIGLTAWSGALSFGFPVPLPLLVIVALSLTAGTVSIIGRSPTLASAIAAGLAVVVVLLHPASVPRATPLDADVRLEAGDSVTVDLPAESHVVRLQITGGNIAGLKSGTVVAIVAMEPSVERRELKIGDFADWGVGRSRHYLSSRNPRPAFMAGAVIGFGRDAFLSGSGLVRIHTDGAERLRIEALPILGENGRLTIERVEVER